jgi:hypothetical protein
METKLVFKTLDLKQTYDNEQCPKNDIFHKQLPVLLLQLSTPH